MSDDQIDITQQIDEPMNTFKVIHLSNRTEKYHLMRQVLLDSLLIQNTYCFFCHILTLTADDFNEMYGSFAYLVGRNDIEADLYLNVDQDALDHIIKYLQTTKINHNKISKNPENISEIIDLATMFGMSNLVAILRSAHLPSN